MTDLAPDPHPRRRFLRHPLALGGLVVLVIAAGAGAYWFEPWTLFTNTTIDDPLPTAAAQPSPGPSEEPQEPVVVSEGALVSQEHETSGTVKLLRLPDSSLVVRVEDLEASNGPDLKVWLTDAPVSAGLDSAGVFDDGRYVDLGPLKGNMGTANYPVPSGTDVSGLDSVSIWCDRFNVSFGAAKLSPASEK